MISQHLGIHKARTSKRVFEGGHVKNLPTEDAQFMRMKNLGREPD